MAHAPRALATVAAIIFIGVATTATRADQEAVPVSRSRIVVSADSVAYYSNQALVLARGAVRVRLGDGTMVTGDAFSMDMGLQRFLVVGHVRLVTPAGSYDGAAFADFLPFRRIYFVPLDPAADRWTFLNGDYAHPEKGRVMPGDAFFLPDVSQIRPYIRAKEAVIDPTSSVSFDAAGFVLFNGALQTPPVGPYVYNFSPSYDFRINSLSGASFDAPYDFAGSDNALSTLHYRYDPQRHSYLSFEQHLLFDKGYTVFSLNPATQKQKQWNLLAYDRTSSHSAIALQAQLFTLQNGFGTPTSSSGFADLQYIVALPHSGARLDLTQAYENLLGTATTPNHPFVAGLAWSGFDEPIFRTGLEYRLLSGIARTHDVYGVSGSGSHDVWSDYLGGTVYTPVFPGPFHTGVNASFTVQRTWLSFPNTLDTQIFSASDSKRLTDKAYLVASYIVTSARTNNLNLTIASPNLATGLVPQPTSATGLPFVLQGNAAATDRLVQLTASIAPSASFQFSLTGQHNHYTPALSGGAFPDQLIGDVRTRISKTLFVDVQRAYIFSTHALSPQFIVQVSSQ